MDRLRELVLKELPLAVVAAKNEMRDARDAAPDDHAPYFARMFDYIRVLGDSCESLESSVDWMHLAARLAKGNRLQEALAALESDSDSEDEESDAASDSSSQQEGEAVEQDDDENDARKNAPDHPLGMKRGFAALHYSSDADTTSESSHARKSLKMEVPAGAEAEAEAEDVA